MKKLPLSCVPIGAVGFVDCVADISSKKRLVEMGFTKKARVIPLHISPGGRPCSILCERCGYSSQTRRC